MDILTCFRDVPVLIGANFQDAVKISLGNWLSFFPRCIKLVRTQFDHIPNFKPLRLRVMSYFCHSRRESSRILQLHISKNCQQTFMQTESDNILTPKSRVKNDMVCFWETFVTLHRADVLGYTD
jgi:hypothetical protein